MQKTRDYQVSNTVQALDAECLVDGEYRIVLMDSIYVYLVELCKRPRKLYRILSAKFDSDFLNDRIIKFKYELPAYLLLPKGELPPEAIVQMEIRLKAINPILKEINDVISGTEIGKKIIKECISLSGIDKTRIYNYFYRFLMFDRIDTALLPAKSMQGGKGVEKRVLNSKKNRGKPRENVEDIETINIEETEKNRIIKTYKRYYKKLHKGTGETCNDLTSLLKALWFDYYRETDSEGDKKLVKKRISIDQLRYWLPILTDGVDRLSRDIGKRNLAKDHKESYGTFSDITNGPAHIYAIDGNTVDCYLGSQYEHTKRHSTGKSLQYNVVDAFSGMLVSTTFDFRPESLARALEALLAAFMKKSDLGKLWGIDIDDKLWPCHRISHTNLADRSSLLSERKNILHARFSVISSDFCPAYRPDQKSLVESTNKLFNEALFHRLPGAVIKALKRGSKNPAELACIDMPDIYKLAYEVQYDINRRLLDRKYLTQEMSKDGVRPTPIDIWNWGVQNCNLYGMDSSEYDKKLMILSLSEQVEPRLNNHGIFLAKTKNQIFYSPNHPKLQKLVRLYNRGGSTTDICQYYTGHRILGSNDFLYLVSKKDNEIIECGLHSRSQRMKNMHIFQTLELLRKESKEDEAIKHENNNNEQKTLEIKRDIVKNKLDRLSPGKKAAKKRARNITEDQRLEQVLNDIEKTERISEVINGKNDHSGINIIGTTKNETKDEKGDRPEEINSDDDFIVGI